MSLSRLTFALAGGAALPGDGTVVVIGPTVEADLSALPRDRTMIVQPMRPAHDAWAARGWQVAPELPETIAATAAIVFLPRARAAARARIAAAVAAVVPGAPVWIDGQKTDGVEPMLRELRQRVDLGEVLSRAHGKVAGFPAPGLDAFADWQARAAEVAPGFVTLPGVFSADGPDPGSVALAAALPARMPRRIADLGAGWGWLAARVLTRPEVAEMHLVEADHVALDCARRNIDDPRARFHWDDVTRFRPEAPFDGIVMNPPFHSGRAAEPDLGQAFIRAAAAMLAPQGRLWMVANRHLPYEAVLRQAFRDLTEIGAAGGFKLFVAARPQRGAGELAPGSARPRPHG